MKMFDALVGPLHKDYCYYFYILAVVFFVSFVGSVFCCLSLLLRKKNRSMKTLSNYLLITINSLTLYFVNRLMFNMCHNSL